MTTKVKKDIKLGEKRSTCSSLYLNNLDLRIKETISPKNRIKVHNEPFSFEEIIGNKIPLFEKTVRPPNVNALEI